MVFRKIIKNYLDKNNDYVCELWSASTKHPDSCFNMKDFKKTEFIEEKYEWFSINVLKSGELKNHILVKYL